MAQGSKSDSLVCESPKLIKPAILTADSPSVAGRFDSTPLGFVLHGSRSGRDWTERKEFNATVSFAQGGANGLGWHATVMSGRVAIHMTPEEWGWNVREFSYRYIGVEFAQARLGNPIPDGAVDAFCWYALEVVRPVWPGIPLFLIHHASTPPGKRDGKSDTFPDGDPRQLEMNERIVTRLRPYWR